MVDEFLKLFDGKITEFVEKEWNLFLMSSDRLNVHDYFCILLVVCAMYDYCIQYISILYIRDNKAVILHCLASYCVIFSTYA